MLYRREGRHAIVEPAHMELAEPSMQDAVDRCVEQGARHIVVAPYFLATGKHWDRDIPRLAAEAVARHAGVTHQVAMPIGLHPLMAKIIDERIDECRGS